MGHIKRSCAAERLVRNSEKHGTLSAAFISSLDGHGLTTVELARARIPRQRARCLCAARFSTQAGIGSCGKVWMEDRRGRPWILRTWVATLQPAISKWLH